MPQNSGLPIFSHPHRYESFGGRKKPREETETQLNFPVDPLPVRRPRRASAARAAQQIRNMTRTAKKPTNPLLSAQAQQAQSEAKQQVMYHVCFFITLLHIYYIAPNTKTNLHKLT